MAQKKSLNSENFKKTLTQNDVDEMIAKKKSAIDVKLKKKQEELLVKQKLNELEQLTRLEDILDCDDEDDAWDLAETEQEKELVRSLFPD